jgi:hypothetical protein
MYRTTILLLGLAVVSIVQSASISLEPIELNREDVKYSRSVGLSDNEIESSRLTEQDIQDLPDLSFGETVDRGHRHRGRRCKLTPDSDDWPSEREWRRLSKQIDGNLLNPMPPAVVCYKGRSYDPAACANLVKNASATHFYLDDPITVLSQWTQGSTCMPALNATGRCTRGGFPVYVVNATKVKHVQAAVNFARNKNIRLIIKYEQLVYIPL